MYDQIKESDWKYLRKISQVALERAFQKGAAEIQRIASDPDLDGRNRFRGALNFAQKYREELALLFDDHRRSTAMEKILAMRTRKALTEQEYAGFRSETREEIDQIIRKFVK